MRNLLQHGSGRAHAHKNTRWATSSIREIGPSIPHQPTELVLRIAWLTFPQIYGNLSDTEFGDATINEIETTTFRMVAVGRIGATHLAPWTPSLPTSLQPPHISSLSTSQTASSSVPKLVQR
jgi:hypothetical protein